MYLEVLIKCTCIYDYYVFLMIDQFSIMKYLFLPVVIIFVLKSILSDNIATPPFSGILFVWYIVFHPRTFNLCLYAGGTKVGLQLRHPLLNTRILLISYCI